MVREFNLQRKRTFWSDEEDARLVELVELYGIHNWPEVATALQGRDSKSCSLRWRYFLAPHIIRSTDQKLSDWEVAVLVWAQREYGNKWRTIVDNYLPWRSPNDLKNYCNQYVSGKHNHVITQNKLLLQNVPLAALLAHPPPEVQERWRHVNSMRDSPKGQQRPAKKGTRGLSYIIRQAAKLKAQRAQPYPKPSTAAPAAAIAAAGADGGCSNHTSPPVSRVDASFSACGMHGSNAAAAYGAPNQAAAAAAAAGAAGYAVPFVPPGLPNTSQALAGAGSSGSSSFSMPYSSPQGSYPSSSSAQGMYAAMPGMNMNAGGGSMNMNMPGGTMQGYPAAAVSGPMQGSVPCSWAPALDCSPGSMNMNMADSNACTMPYTPSSASSCFTSSGITPMNAMNVASTGMTSMGMPAMTHGMSCSGRQLAPVSIAEAGPAVGPAAGGAFGQQGSSTAVATPPQLLNTAGGPYAMWQEPPMFVGSNGSGSISSNSSDSVVDAAGFASPTNQSFTQPQYHHQQQLQQQQQQSTAGAGVPLWQPNGVAGLPQQLLGAGFQQQQQQLANTCMQTQGLLLPLPMQLQQHHISYHHHQQQQQDDADARSSGTGAPSDPAGSAKPLSSPSAAVGDAGAAAAAAAVGSPFDSFDSMDLLQMEAVDDEDLDGIADLLGSDCGDDFGISISRCHAPSAAAVAAAAADCIKLAPAQAATGPAAAAGLATADIAADAAAAATAAPSVTATEAQHATVTATAAAATDVTALKFELQSVQLSDTVTNRLEAPSDGGAAGADIDFDALLGVGTDDALDFQVSSDEFDLLVQAAAW